MTTRREIFKLGAVGALGLAGFKGGDDDIPTTGTTAPAATPVTASPLAPQNMPVPYRGVFRRPPELVAVRDGLRRRRPGPTVRPLRPHRSAGPMAQFLPGLSTTGGRATTASSRGRPSGPAGAPGSRCGSATRFPPTGLLLPAAHRHLHPPARLGVAAAVRRVRQRHHRPGLRQDLPVPQLPDGRAPSGTTTTGTYVTAQNVYSGLAGFYPLSDQFERAQLPQGEFDVPLMISDAHVQRRRLAALRRQRRQGAVGRRHHGQRRAVADDEGQAPDLPVPGARSPRSHAPTGPRCPPATPSTSSAPTPAWCP